MKKYIVPRMNNEIFVSNGFVSACYKIKCTTPHGNASYINLYDDSNGNGKLDDKDKQLYHSIWGFRGCNKWHNGIIIDEAPVANGFVTQGLKEIRIDSIYWWEEELGASSDYHVMVPGKENYETNPNAS